MQINTVTPARGSRRSQRNIGTPRSSKYRESQQQPEVTAFVKEKMRELSTYDVRSSKKISESGEKRAGYVVEPSGKIYRGSWKDEEPHGYGEVFLRDGSYYQGTLTNGYAHGEGRYIFSKSCYY